MGVYHELRRLAIICWGGGGRGAALVAHTDCNCLSIYHSTMLTFPHEGIVLTRLNTFLASVSLSIASLSLFMMTLLFSILSSILSSVLEPMLDRGRDSGSAMGAGGGSSVSVSS